MSAAPDYQLVTAISVATVRLKVAQAAVAHLTHTGEQEVWRAALDEREKAEIALADLQAQAGIK